MAHPRMYNSILLIFVLGNPPEKVTKLFTPLNNLRGQLCSSQDFRDEPGRAGMTIAHWKEARYKDMSCLPRTTARFDD